MRLAGGVDVCQREDTGDRAGLGSEGQRQRERWGGSEGDLWRGRHSAPHNLWLLHLCHGARRQHKSLQSLAGRCVHAPSPYGSACRIVLHSPAKCPPPLVRGNVPASAPLPLLRQIVSTTAPMRPHGARRVPSSRHGAACSRSLSSRLPKIRMRSERR